MRFILLMLFFVSVFYGKAQFIVFDEVYQGAYTEIKRTIDYENITGSPYLEEELYRGRVIFLNGDTTQYYMRYNVLEDEMEYLENKYIKSISNSVIIIKIELYERTYRFRPNFPEKKSKSPGGYFIELDSGAYTLFKKPIIVFEKSEPPSNSYVAAKPDRFTRRSDEYYYEFNNEITHLKGSKSNLISIIPNKEKELKSFIKKNKIKPSKEEDLILFFQFLNELYLED